MKEFSYILAILLGMGGLIFLVGAGQGNTVVRVIIGVVLLGAAGFMVYLARSKGPEMKVTHQVDFTGETELEELRCRACSGRLNADSVEMREGAIYVDCPYCGTSYQLEERAKW